MMNEFMQQPQHMQQTPVPPMAMEQMHRQFDNLTTGPAQQRQSSPQQNWAGEFDPGREQANLAQRAPGFDPREFERYAQTQPGPMLQEDGTASPSMMNSYQRPMGMGGGYSSLYGSGMGMGMGSSLYGGGMGMSSSIYGGGMQQPLQPNQMQSKGKERMVELDDEGWEAQFAELDQQKGMEGDLDEAAMEAQLNDIDRSVLSSTDHLGAFEDVWQKIKAETVASLDRGMFDAQFDEDRYRGHQGEFADDWDNFDSNGLNTHLRDPQMGQYMFEEDNMFSSITNPFDEGVKIMDEGGNLSLAALAFEAAVQKDPNHVEAWTRLGAAQAQNEKESPAIRALEQALTLDPTNLEALMGLAVSYTNEGYDSTAYRTLERWLGTKYPSVIPWDARDPLKSSPLDPFGPDITFTDREALHKRVTDYFIQAAQLAPTPEAMDPDVQVGLGVLFYGAEEYDKAVDCFSSALASSEQGMTNSELANQRPLLWNRLGATLANSGRSEEAIQAYEKALELNPSFVRARYNLGVSCINIGVHESAAQHLLGALAMHQMVEKEGKEKARELMGGAGGDGKLREQEIDTLIRHNQSTNLYDTLRRVFGQMDRRDLADKVVSGVDVDIFRGEFDF